MGTIDTTTSAIYKLAKDHVRKVGEGLGLDEFCLRAVRAAVFQVELGYPKAAVKELLSVPPRHGDAVEACFVTCVEAAYADWYA